MPSLTLALFGFGQVNFPVAFTISPPMAMWGQSGLRSHGPWHLPLKAYIFLFALPIALAAKSWPAKGTAMATALPPTLRFSLRLFSQNKHN